MEQGDREDDDPQDYAAYAAEVQRRALQERQARTRHRVSVLEGNRQEELDYERVLDRVTVCEPGRSLPE
jgi:hypothetical protein